MSSAGVIRPGHRARAAFAVLAVTAGVLGALTGCATKGIPYKRLPAAGPSAGATAPTAATTVPAVSRPPLPAAAGQLTGTQMEAVLLPASFFPAGFTAPASGPVTSGGSLLATPAAANNLATMACSIFVERIGETGFGETAVAAVSLAGSAQDYGEFIYQFAAPAAATAFVAGIRALAGRCGSFPVTSGGQSGTYSLRAAAGGAVGGHPALILGETGATAGHKLIINTLFSVSGVDVFAASAVGVDAGAPAVPATQTIIYNLMKRQAAAAVLS